MRKHDTVIKQTFNKLCEFPNFYKLRKKVNNNNENSVLILRSHIYRLDIKIK
jgi:hypothetical protein